MRLSEYLEETGESQTAFALRVGVTQSAVAQWVAGGLVKAENVLTVAAATDWRVTPNELRSDLYPHTEDGMPRSVAARKAAPVAPAV